MCSMRGWLLPAVDGRNGVRDLHGGRLLRGRCGERFLATCAASLLGVAGLGIFSTGLAALVFFRLVDRAGATFVSLTNYLVPVFAAVAGFLVFGEELKLRVLMGLALILAGIAVSEWRASLKE